MSAPKDEVVFSWEWLLLDKPSIEILSYLLLNGGRFAGSTTALCDALGRSNNTESICVRQESINKLCAAGAVSHKQLSKRRFEICLVPPSEEKQIRIERQHLENIQRRRYDRSVAWQQVLKVYLWLKAWGGPVEFTMNDIAVVLGVSKDTVSSAVRVLADHYGAMTTKPTYFPSAKEIRRKGTEANLSAFWLNN